MRVVVTGATAVAVLGALAWLAWSWQASRLPGTYAVMRYGSVDDGGGPRGGAVRTTSVAELHGPAGTPDARFRLVARHAVVRLASGRTVDALTFDGRAPGPELRVRQGDLVAVTLVNRDVEDGVTIHWHGVDVPNAEDGVAGVTQDAVAPGRSYTYRFRATRAGTYWYHTHQSSSDGVERGLFGAFVVEPAGPRPPGLDLVAIAHDFDGAAALNTGDGTTRRAVRPGTRVRLRLVNSDSAPERFTVSGAPFRVVAIDGGDVHAPGLLRDERLELAAGGRYDVELTMPARPVGLRLVDTDAAIVLSPGGRAAAPPPAPGGRTFDPLAYGTRAAAPFGASSRFDRSFTLSIGRKLGFLDGTPGSQWTVNGHIYPDVPMFVVRRDDLVRVTIRNRTGSVHPMHLHGHHVLVLSRNGVPASGSPWWSDTLELRGQETYVVAFRADNPGLWMDHCHNLGHASAGLTMHVMYAGVGTPFVVGGPTHNHPE